MKKKFFKKDPPKKNFFKRGKLPDPTIILDDFLELLENKTAESKLWVRFLKALENNYDFYEKLADSKKFDDLPVIFTHLYNKAEISKSKFNAQKKKLFPDHDNRYLEEFKVKSKDGVKIMGTLPEDNLSLPKGDPRRHDPTRKYFRKFLIETVFWCAVGNCKLKYHSNPAKIVQQLSAAEEAPGFRKEYYLFYNRSNVRKHEIGIGKVAILNDHDAELEYYYGPNPADDEEKKRGYKIVKTSRRVKAYPDSSILVLKAPEDNDDPGNTKNDNHIESFFVVKRYDSKDEKILLGFSSSWNRKQEFPYATAILLIDKGYYDGQFTKDKNQYFENIKQRYTLNPDNKDENIPPGIYYYLYHQLITLEAAIWNNNENSENPERPFTDIEQIPFYKNESEHLPLIKGRYKGLTVIYDRGEDVLIVSELKIFENGMVHLFIKKTDKGKISDEKIVGFVKYMTIEKEQMVFISLRYNYIKNYNSLNLCLEFDAEAREKGKKVTLKGGYSGEGRFTDKPIAGTVIFSEVDEDETVETGEIPFFEEEKLNDQIRELYDKNSSMLRFFISKNSYQYSNHHGINILDQYLRAGAPVTKTIKYDVFIAIPLTHNNSKNEYTRNLGLVVELCSELETRFGFKKIFCACLDEKKNNEPLSYGEYISQVLEPERMYKDVQDRIRESEFVFFVYPQMIFSEIQKYRISSAIVEIGYALGQGKDVIILYDDEKHERMPLNLMTLYKERSYLFSTGAATPIKDMFERARHESQIRKQLKLE